MVEEAPGTGQYKAWIGGNMTVKLYSQLEDTFSFEFCLEIDELLTKTQEVLAKAWDGYTADMAGLLEKINRLSLQVMQENSSLQKEIDFARQCSRLGTSTLADNIKALEIRMNVLAGEKAQLDHFLRQLSDSLTPPVPNCNFKDYMEAVQQVITYSKTHTHNMQPLRFSDRYPPHFPPKWALGPPV
jgi:hypothetical protein